MEDKETLLEFPCDFPIKAMGYAEEEFDMLVVELVNRHLESSLAEDAVTRRESAGGKYVSVTVTVRATSREQLDNIYRDLTDCDKVLMAL